MRLFSRFFPARNRFFTGDASHRMSSPFNLSERKGTPGEHQVLRRRSPTMRAKRKE